jgi:type II secretory pathway pseudopilin PulG
MNRERSKGLSLVEVLGSVAIGALVIAGLAGIATQTSRARERLTAASQLEEQAQFALERMLRAARATDVLLVPRPERGGTAYSEAVRNVLALALDPTLDRDANGFADADNDRDGRIDEDFDDDMTKDNQDGIVGIDDDGDGSTDEGDSKDDDEDGARDEDERDRSDDDGDGVVDEDVKRDNNDDGEPGLEDVDDDGDSSTDEGNKEDDDEDGTSDEDWLDVVVYRLSGTTLLERLPNLNASSGTAFTERAIATDVASFRVEYIAPVAAGRPVLLDLTLTLTGAGGASTTLNARTRLGADL